MKEQKSKISPPLIGLKILEILLPSDDRQYLIEGISETYNQKINRKGRIFALIWYWKDFLLTILNILSEKLFRSPQMFGNYFKIAFRNMKRYKSFSLVNILGLAAGMASCIIISLWVIDELSQDSHNDKLERLYRLSHVERLDIDRVRFADEKSSEPLAEYLIENYPEVENASKFLKRGTKSLRYDNKVFNESGVAFVDPEYFDLFTIEIINGDIFNSLTGSNIILISEEIANKYFSGEDPVGKVLVLENQYDLEVKGVFRNLPKNSHFSGYKNIDCLLPFEFASKLGTMYHEWDEFYLHTYALLKENSDPKKLNEKISGLIAEKSPDMTKYDFYFEPIKDIGFYDINGNSTGMKTIYIYISLAAMIMIIACINYMNLATAFSFRRAKEIGLRKVVGAKRSGITKQFICESMVIAFSALLLSSIMVKLSLPYFSAILQKPLELNMDIMFQCTPWLIGLVILTGLLSGSYPAFIMSAFRPVSVLKGSGNPGRGKHLLRKTMVILQFTISIILIISSIVVFQQFDLFIKSDKGYDDSNVICFRNKTGEFTRLESLKNELIQDNSIISIGSGSVIPGYSTTFAGTNWDWDGKNPETKPLIQGIYAGYDFFVSLNLDIISGEGFKKSRSNANDNYIVINENTAKLIGFENPIGKTFSYENRSYTIIGVMENYAIFTLKYRIDPMIVNFAPERSNYSFIKSSSVPGSMENTLNNLKDKWSKYFPEYPLDYYYLADLTNSRYTNEDNLGKLFRYFTFLSILICGLGIYSLMSLFIHQRSKEVSIRKILGAKNIKIMMLLSGESIRCALIANMIAIPVGWYLMSNWLQNYAFRIDIGISVYLFAGFLSLLLGIVPIVHQLIKTALANPSEALRHQ